MNDPARTEKDMVDILADIAVGVLEGLVQMALVQYADNQDAFCDALVKDDGAAELGMGFARFIYQDADGGTLIGPQQKVIRQRLEEGISKAKLEFWKNYHPNRTEGFPAQAPAPLDVAAAAERRKAFF